MSGYRRHGFDPNAYEEPGRPLRPFNGVQWLGVAFAACGAAFYLAYFAGRLGWTRELLDKPTIGLPLALVGLVLINSRRHPPADPAPELASARRRSLFITVAVCAAVLGFAAVIELKGA